MATTWLPPRLHPLSRCSSMRRCTSAWCRIFMRGGSAIDCLRVIVVVDTTGTV